jgi:mercuric ion binding protein
MTTRNFAFAALLLLLPFLAEAKSISVQVKGMVCAFCAQGIEKKFKSLPEITKVHVSLETKLVSLETQEGKDIPDDQIKKIITESGYDVVKIERAK